MSEPGHEGVALIRLRIVKPSPRTVVGLGAGLIVLVTALYLPPVYSLLGASIVTLVINLVQAVGAVILVSLTISVWWSAERDEPIKQIAGSLSIGLLLWAIGQIAYAWDSLERGPLRFEASLADAFWVAGYIPILIGLYLRLKTFGPILGRAGWRLVLVGNGILAILAIVFVVRPILFQPGQAHPLMTVINLLYTVGNLLVVLASTLIMQTFSRGAMSPPWRLVAAGCLMYSISDLLFAYGTWSGAFAPQINPAPTPIVFAYNILFMSAYVTAAAGTYWLARLHGVL